MVACIVCGCIGFIFGACWFWAMFCTEAELDRDAYKAHYMSVRDECIALQKKLDNISNIIAGGDQ